MKTMCFYKLINELIVRLAYRHFLPGEAALLSGASIGIS